MRENDPNARKFGIAGVSGVSRSNAVREDHPNAGKFGTAGISGVSRSNAVRKNEKHRTGKSKERRKVNDLIVTGVVGSFTDTGGMRRSSRVGGFLQRHRRHLTSSKIRRCDGRVDQEI